MSGPLATKHIQDQRRPTAPSAADPRSFQALQCPYYSARKDQGSTALLTYILFFPSFFSIFLVLLDHVNDRLQRVCDPGQLNCGSRVCYPLRCTSCRSHTIITISPYYICHVFSFLDQLQLRKVGVNSTIFYNCN